MASSRLPDRSQPRRSGADCPPYALDTFSQGLDAVDAAERALRAGTPYAAALIDMRMQPGIDGLETAQRIRVIDPELQFIFVTAYSDHGTDQISRLIGRDILWFSKPFSFEELYQAVRSCVTSWNRGHELQQMRENLASRVELQTQRLNEKLQSMELLQCNSLSREQQMVELKRENLRLRAYQELRLLLSREPLPEPQALDPAQPAPTLLLVDDTNSVRATYRAQLEQIGYRVVVADSVEQGMAEALQHAPDLALVDYYMPHGNGSRLLARFREDPRTQRILPLLFSNADEAASVAAGAVAWLRKEMEMEEFLQRMALIRDYIQQRKAEQRARRSSAAQRLQTGDRPIDSPIDSSIACASAARGAAEEEENRRVLLVDDEEDNLTLLRSILGAEKPNSIDEGMELLEGQVSTSSPAVTPQNSLQPRFEVTAVTRGSQAILAVEQAQRSNTPYAVALIDMRMPPGIDGLETARQIRQISPDIEIVIITAYSDYSLGEIRQGLGERFSFLTKPYNDEVVLQRVVEGCSKWADTHRIQRARSMLFNLAEDMEEEIVRRRQTEMELQQEKHYMERVLDSMSEALLVVEPDATIRDCNPALLRLTGLQRKALLGRPFGTLFAEEEEELFRAQILPVVSSRLQRTLDKEPQQLQQYCHESPLAVLLVDAEAQIVLTNAAAAALTGWSVDELMENGLSVLLPEKMRSGHEEMVHAFIHNPVSRKMGEDRLLPLLTRTGETLIVEIGLFPLQLEGAPQTLVVLHNPEERALWNLFTMSSLGTLFAEEEEEEEEEEVSADRMLVNAAGTQIPVSLNGALLQTPDGEGRGAVLVVHDLRERRRSEEREQYAAFQSGVAEMSANILHNVGNTIQGMDVGEGELLDRLQDLQRVHDFYEGFRDQLKAAEAEGDAQALKAARERMIAAGLKLPDALHSGVIEPSRVQMKRLSVGISHIKEVIRAQQKGVEIDTHAVRFQLPALLEDLRLLTEGEVDKRSIVVEEEVVQPMPELRLPRNQLLQALINLIKNSAESIEERIFVQQQQKEAGHAAPAEDGKIRISAQTEEKMLLLEVSDNGNGFKPELAQELIRFGYTTKMDGSGFGLHATGNFVNSIGGSLQLESDGVGQGATARIRLPLTSTDG